MSKCVRVNNCPPRAVEQNLLAELNLGRDLPRRPDPLLVANVCDWKSLGTKWSAVENACGRSRSGHGSARRLARDSCAAPFPQRKALPLWYSQVRTAVTKITSGCDWYHIGSLAATRNRRGTACRTLPQLLVHRPDSLSPGSASGPCPSGGGTVGVASHPRLSMFWR